MENSILDKYLEHGVSVGTLSHLNSITAVEAIGAAGFDYILLDGEHSPLSATEMAHYVCAAKAAGLTAVVRTSEINRSEVLHALDVGAGAVVVPCIETVEQVKELVEWTKFPPYGQRGYCMTGDADWGYGDEYKNSLKGYMKIANEQTLLLPQCETLGCLEHIEEIVHMNGVSGILIGPFDLSIAMGIPEEFSSPRFQDTLGRIRRACREAGKICMIFSGNAEDASLKAEEGYDSLLFGLDVITLIRSYRTDLETIRKKSRNIPECEDKNN
jgi:2,4-dihydroxyhept-2-ene-1,7-dioic acid aldolase